MDKDPGRASFADSGSEQDAFAEYLIANYPNSNMPYNQADEIADSSITDDRIVRDDNAGILE